MNYTQQDELAQLFAQNMHLAQQSAPQPQPQQDQAPVTVEQIPPPSEKQDQQVHYISQHYTQTAHIRPDTTSEPSLSPPPPYNEALMPEAMSETLRQHSIDPSALLPNQIHLFQNADYEQRLRLLELWRIAPPSYPLELHVQNKWTPTSVAQEEAEARQRYEQNQQMKVMPPEEHMLDTTLSEPISPIREPGETPWPPAARMRAASIAANAYRLQTRQEEAEPYIVNGYQVNQSAQAVDPVYAAAAGLWQAPSYAQAIQIQDAAMQQQNAILQQQRDAIQQQNTVMEDQYGMYQQIRNHRDWEAMNEQIAREKFVGLHGPMEMGDEDMVM